MAQHLSFIACEVLKASSREAAIDVAMRICNSFDKVASEERDWLKSESMKIVDLHFSPSAP